MAKEERSNNVQRECCYQSKRGIYIWRAPTIHTSLPTFHDELTMSIVCLQRVIGEHRRDLTLFLGPPLYPATKRDIIVRTDSRRVYELRSVTSVHRALNRNTLLSYTFIPFSCSRCILWLFLWTARSRQGIY